jgi:hypothetical protein
VADIKYAETYNSAKATSPTHGLGAELLNDHPSIDLVAHADFTFQMVFSQDRRHLVIVQQPVIHLKESKRNTTFCLSIRLVLFFCQDGGFGDGIISGLNMPLHAEDVSPGSTRSRFDIHS